MKLTTPLLLGAALGLSACGSKKNDGTTPAATPPSNTPPLAQATSEATSAATSTATSGTSSSDTSTATSTEETQAQASVRLGIKPIAAQGDFLTSLSASNSGSSTPGSLLLSLGLRSHGEQRRNYVQRLALVDGDSYRTPVNSGYSIASGAPDEFIIYVKRIELSNAALEEQQEGEGDDDGPASLKSQHVELFDEAYADELTALVDQEYANSQDLIDAIASATGLETSTVQSALMDAYQAGELAASGDGVAADSDDEDPVVRSVLIESDEGLPLRIVGGSVDLSELFGEGEDADVFSVDATTYRSVKIVLKERSQIKGCVKMHFQCRGQDFCATNEPTDDQPGNLGLGADELAELVYCTAAAHSPYDNQGSQNSNFLDLEAPELMDMPLGHPNSEWLADGEMTLEFAIPEPVELGEGDAIDLTMAVDLNRMLRYYNRGRADSGPGPESATDAAYFFTSVFQQSIYVFVGEPGKVYSYEALARVCNSGDTYNADTEACAATDADDMERVGFAITIITDADGEPLVFNLTPDDDNDLTITKGSITDHSRCPFDDNAAWARASDIGDGYADVIWALCDGSSGEPGPYGRMLGFPAALDDVAVAGPDVAFGDDDATGEFSVLLKSVLRQSSEDEATEREGTINIKRRL